MHSIGADHVIDYTKDNYFEKGEFFDLIIDVVGKNSVSRRLKLLKPDGYYFLAYAELSHILLGKWVSLTAKKQLKIKSSSQSKEDLLFLKELIETGNSSQSSTKHIRWNRLLKHIITLNQEVKRGISPSLSYKTTR